MDISSMLEVEVQEVADSKENVTPIRKTQQVFSCQTYGKEENDFYKLTYGSDVASVRFLRLHCTGCDEHIGSAPAEAHNMHEHPVLRTLLCAKCREFYGDGTFEQGDDATDMFCRWCANGGNLYCCSYCSNTFCSKCIKRNFDPPTIKRIEAEDSWKCFVCDPKDLFPLRSICRGLITHIETVTRILENDRRMSPKEVEEKMHLDETKCCSRKRKRRRRRTLSNSDDEEEDTSYVPEVERADTPPMKKRKVRSNTVRNVYSNGFMDHEYHHYDKKRPKVEPDLDPEDLLIPCEQTMIEGDTEIINPNDSDDSGATSPTKEGQNTPARPNTTRRSQSQEQPPQQQQQQQQHLLPKLLPKPPVGTNNTMAINPVPLANLLKVALSTGAKKIKVTHGPNQKLVAVPMSAVPKAVASSSITFVKPTTHFLVPKSVAKSIGQSVTQSQPQSQPQLQQKQKQQQQPSVIDLDSDDEPVILENSSKNSSKTKRGNRVSVGNHSEIEIDDAESEQIQLDADDAGDEPVMVMSRSQTAALMSLTAATRTRSSGDPDSRSHQVFEGHIPLKTRQRDRQFKKMLHLQSQEIDNTWAELKTKIFKLVQMSNMKQQQDTDPLNAAGLCTKRFHRALRKALVELSHINDRVVRDYVNWKKKTDKAAAGVKSEVTEETEKPRKEKTSTATSAKDGITLEMICERESEPEEDDDIEEIDNDEYTLDATNMPPDFSQILDHLSIFKRKPSAIKAIGDNSVFTEDKACQAYDVPWRDYEKCIGYSLVTKSEYNPETKEETLVPVAMPDENFGKYQEQFLFYLQHIEDHGIKTDETKGLPDPNHIPLKDLIDGTSPFIMDMLERLSPVTLSNGCASPLPRTSPANGEEPTLGCSETLPTPMDTSSPAPVGNETNENDQGIEIGSVTTEKSDTENAASDDANAAPTSKAVQELQKMVTKLQEDLRGTQTTTSTDEVEEPDAKTKALEEETLFAVNSLLQEQDTLAVEIMETDDSDKCTTLE